MEQAILHVLVMLDEMTTQTNANKQTNTQWKLKIKLQHILNLINQIALIIDSISETYTISLIASGMPL